MSNVLDLYDQTYFSFGRAAGVTNLLQCVWVYDRGIDVDGLRRFHHQLQQGLLSRRIERSPLPFGRHRWLYRASQGHGPLPDSGRERIWMRQNAAHSMMAAAASMPAVEDQTAPTAHLC